MTFDGYRSSWFARRRERSALSGSHPTHGLADNLGIVRFGEEQTALGHLKVLCSNMPEVRMISTGGQRSRMPAASFIPSMLPGMLMSVKTIRMSLRLSKMQTASSALDASIGLKPASSTTLTAIKRRMASSSTTRTTVLGIAETLFLGARGRVGLEYDRELIVRRGLRSQLHENRLER
jgi:hypothetical protein